MKFAHKHAGVKGGTQIVTVTEHNGNGLVKTTVIPTEMSKQLNVPFKTSSILWNPATRNT